MNVGQAIRLVPVGEVVGVLLAHLQARDRGAERVGQRQPVQQLGQPTPGGDHDAFGVDAAAVLCVTR